jgi:flagellar biosynthesis protein FlhF
MSAVIPGQLPSWKQRQEREAMKSKSFFADRVHDAMLAARAELGSDAVLLSSHRTPADVRHLGEFEVICGYTEKPVALELSAPPAARRPIPTVQDAPAAQERLAPVAPRQERRRPMATPLERNGRMALATRSQKVEWRRIRRSLTEQGFPGAIATDITRAVYRRLTGEEAPDVEFELMIDPETARAQAQMHSELASILPLLDLESVAVLRNRAEAAEDAMAEMEEQNVMDAPDATAAEEALAQELAHRLPMLRTGGQSVVPTGHVVALVGPAGAGKSLTAAKIAMTAIAGRERPVRIVSVSGRSAGASARLAALAAILEVPFQSIESPEELGPALSEQMADELVIVDTPGFSRREEESTRRWARELSSSEIAHITLVLSATTKPADLFATARQFSLFHPDSLTFTHGDCTAEAGSCLALAISARMPVAYWSEGQEIPEDLGVPQADEFVRKTMPALLAAV